MGQAARKNPVAQATKRGELKPREKQQTFRQRIVEARIQRFQQRMKPRREDGA